MHHAASSPFLRAAWALLPSWHFLATLSLIGVSPSLGGRLLWEQEVAGSSPATPTIPYSRLRGALVGQLLCLLIERFGLFVILRHL